MTTDFVEDNITITDPDAPSTRWEAGPLDLGDVHDEQERGGIILAALVALLLPLIVAAAVLLPGSATDDAVATDERRSGTGLDEIGVDPDPIRSEIPDPDPGVDAEVRGRVEAAEIEGPAADPSPGDTVSTTIVAPSTIDPAPATIGTLGEVVASTVAPGSADVPTTRVAPSSTVAPETTTAPSSTVASTATTAPATTTPTSAPTTTVALEPATTLPPVSVDPTAFQGRVEIGQIGENFVRYRFTAETTTSYAVVVRDDDEIVATTAGTAVGGEEVSKSTNGLTPGTDYTVRVRLFGPPEALSAPVAFRTKGGEPDPSDVPVEILDAVVVDVSSTRVLVTYRTNVCANGSFVIREVGGDVVGRNGGQNGGCLFRHSAEPGFWTPPLEPDTTYGLTISAEAGGRGQGDNNTASIYLEVTTTG